MADEVPSGDSRLVRTNSEPRDADIASSNLRQEATTPTMKSWELELKTFAATGHFPIASNSLTVGL